MVLGRSVEGSVEGFWGWEVSLGVGGKEEGM